MTRAEMVREIVDVTEQMIPPDEAVDPTPFYEMADPVLAQWLLLARRISAQRLECVAIQAECAAVAPGSSRRAQEAALWARIHAYEAEKQKIDDDTRTAIEHQAAIDTGAVQ